MTALFAAISIFALISIQTALSAPAKTSSAPLGSVGFAPSMERAVGWRGDGSGRFPGATPATEWSMTKNVRWMTVVGGGYSSPIVTDQFAFVTSEPNLLVCVVRTNGMVRWKLQVTPAQLADPKLRKIAEDYTVPKDGSGMAAATPITDGKNIYAVFANGLVCAVSLDGKRQWTICIDAEQNTGYGRSSSPIIVAGKLIVHMSNLYAFDPATGRRLWVNAEAKSSYGTPAVSRVGDVDLIITPLGEVVRADDGRSVNSDIAHTSHSSPVSSTGGVFFADVSINAFRFNAALKEQEVWNGSLAGEVFGSPLLHKNLLFLITGGGELFAFDADGKGEQEPLIDGRSLFEKGQGITPIVYASITLVGPYLFVNSNKGETVVFHATRQAQIISRNKLSSGSGASPVFAGKDMFLRDGDKLLCIGE